MPVVREVTTHFTGGRVVRPPGGRWPYVENVLICGAESDKGYGYPPAVFTDDALALYEGAPSYLNHAVGSPDVQQKLAVWENARRNAAGLPVGRYVVNPKHPFAEQFLSAAEHKPNFYTMSHHVDLDFNRAGGRRVVERINKVFSIDVVGEGGTTKGIYEHRGAGPVRSRSMTVREYAKRVAGRLNDMGQIKALYTVAAAAGEALMPAGTVDPADVPAVGNEGIKAAFRATAEATLRSLFDGRLSFESAVTELRKLYESLKTATGSKADYGTQESRRGAAGRSGGEAVDWLMGGGVARESARPGGRGTARTSSPQSADAALNWLLQTTPR